MYLRFTTSFVNQHGLVRTGIFNAVEFVLKYACTDRDDAARIAELNHWFNTNLKVPACYADYDDPHNPSPLAWFKDSATEHIRQMRTLIDLLAKYDVVTDMIHRRDPGRIIYDDEFQVAALPREPLPRVR